MDEYCQNGILIAATNHYELLDSAKVGIHLLFCCQEMKKRKNMYRQSLLWQ